MNFAQLPPLIAAQAVIFTMFLKVKFMPMMVTINYVYYRSVFVCHKNFESIYDICLPTSPLGVHNTGRQDIPPKNYDPHLYAKPAKGQPWPTCDDYDDIHLFCFTPESEYVDVFNKGGVGRRLKVVWNTDDKIENWNAIIGQSIFEFDKKIVSTFVSNFLSKYF